MPKGIKGFQKGHTINKGKKLPHIGTPHTKEAKIRIGLASKKRCSDIKYRQNLSEKISRYYSSLPLSEKTGPLSHHWKGGITKLADRIRRCFKYRQWRDDVFTRDNFTCQMCGNRGNNLHAHHIKSFSKIIQFYEITTLEEALNYNELWNINNGITLCKKCHNTIHKPKKVI